MVFNFFWDRKFRWNCVTIQVIPFYLNKGPERIRYADSWGPSQAY